VPGFKPASIASIMSNISGLFLIAKSMKLSGERSPSITFLKPCSLSLLAIYEPMKSSPLNSFPAVRTDTDLIKK